jgi:hypothetical protein
MRATDDPTVPKPTSAIRSGGRAAGAEFRTSEVRAGVMVFELWDPVIDLGTAMRLVA